MGNKIMQLRARAMPIIALLGCASASPAGRAAEKPSAVPVAVAVASETPKPASPSGVSVETAIPVAKAVAAFSPVPSTPAESKTDPGGTARWLTGQSMDGLNDKRPLVIGDKLSFTVVEDELPPVSLTVTDSGEMDVPYLGRVMAAQKTCKQLALQIKAQLEKEFYYQATVLIGLDSAGMKVVSKGKVYVVGQVRAQGPQEIPVDEVWTVSKAVLRAGGFAPYANKRKVKLVRGGSGRGETETVFVDLVDVLEKGETRKDPEVSPDDLIVVSEKLINF